MRWRWLGGDAIFIGYAKSNVWSRAARRAERKEMPRWKRMLSNVQDVSGDEENEEQNSSDEEEDDINKINEGDYENEDDDDEAVLGFKIRLQGVPEGYAIHIRWLLGNDSVVFESFCGMMKRQMTT